MKRKVFLTLSVALIVCCLMPEMVLAQTSGKDENQKPKTRREKRVVSLLDEKKSETKNKKESGEYKVIIWIQKIKESISPADSFPFFNRNEITVDGFFDKEKFIVEGNIVVRLDEPIEKVIPAFSLLKLRDMKLGTDKKTIITMYLEYFDKDEGIIYKLSFSLNKNATGYVLNKEGSVVVGKDKFNVTYSVTDECLLVILFGWYDLVPEEE